ncbi:MAG: hypothetical protein LCH90_17445 [Proteobacteria bacterium]|nr:hypothetical protein [Pseudomonadota bacterium]
MNRVFQSLGIGMLALASVRAGEDFAFFEGKVLPLLQSRCYECHSHEKKIKGGLALDSKAGWQAGGDNGMVIVPGDPKQSHLIEAVQYTNPEMEMPPKGKLSANEIAIFEQWVSMGAPDSRVKKTASSARVIDLEAGRKFWAFRPVHSEKPPEVGHKEWPLDPVDQFILAALEAKGMKPSPDADAGGADAR